MADRPIHERIGSMTMGDRFQVLRLPCSSNALRAQLAGLQERSCANRSRTYFIGEKRGNGDGGGPSCAKGTNDGGLRFNFDSGSESLRHAFGAVAEFVADDEEGSPATCCSQLEINF